jgi:ADP-ribose pyrophosphatase
MRVIVIGDGLTRDALSLEYPFRTSRSNVGRREIERLMGAGKQYGNGPLPSFVRSILIAAAETDGPRFLLLDQEVEDDGVIGVDDEHSATLVGSAVVGPIEEIAEGAIRIPSSPDVLPWSELGRHVGAADSAGEWPDTRVLVLGCNTEGRILAIASFLKSVLGCPRVAVSSHLVASVTQEAHYAALRHNLPGAGIEVLLDLDETAEFAGLDPSILRDLDRRPCAIEPAEAREALEGGRRRIVELLCMHWTAADLRPLAGGFSGSLLFLAEGWKGEARTEPMVLKIDDFSAMRRELTGYHQVKDFFGKHVPTFGYPVTVEDWTGVGMDLAAMEGRPQTLQDTFEEADGEDGLALFLRRLSKALTLVSTKLYGNTSYSSWVVPYRAFGLHAEQQAVWFRENADVILSYLEDTQSEAPRVNVPQIEKLLRLVASNEDGIDSEVCLTHGDLNLANIICDDGDNIWFIDWTHSDLAPLELDFAKLENDAKFVMSKDFDVDDLDRLKRLEEFFLSHRLPPPSENLPDDLKFVKWDLRYRKIYEAIGRIRAACFDLKTEGEEDWVVYRAALLRYALHTLSFDKRRERGECELAQLMHALYSVEGLVFDLIADDFHLKIRAERPKSYPPRLRVSIDEAPWVLDCPGYDPPYHVDEAVLGAAETVSSYAWADPEQIEFVQDEDRIRDTRFKDDSGRPLNPRGRTGIAGRGKLGLWGRNLSVAAVITRESGAAGQVEILLGRTADEVDLLVPKGFVRSGEASGEALNRVVAAETGWKPGEVDPVIVFEDFTYDRRQTDHAWVESRAYMLHLDASGAPISFEPGGDFDEIQWWPLDADTVNRVPSGQALFIRSTVEALVESGRLGAGVGEDLLARTG